MNADKMQRMVLMKRTVEKVLDPEWRKAHKVELHDEYQSVRRGLEESDWVQLGNGNYGAAFKHDSLPGWVLKISGRVPGDSYPAWVYYCMANPADCLPVFENPVFSESRKVFMVMMPKYESLEHIWNEDIRTNDLAHCYYRLTEILNYHGCLCAGDAYYDVRYGATCTYQPIYPQEVEALKAREFFGCAISWDMHSGNIMLDPATNTMIITDPIHEGNVPKLIARIRGIEPVWKGEMIQRNLELQRDWGCLIPPGFHEVKFTNQLAQALAVDLASLDLLVDKIDGVRALPNGYAERPAIKQHD